VSPEPKSRLHSLAELVIIVAIAVGLAFLVQAFLVKPYKIPSGSMEPTLVPGQRVLVAKVAYDLGSPAVGDVVVFHPPEGAKQELCGPQPHVVVAGGRPCDQPIPKESSENFIKRIVAGPGEEIFVSEGHVYRCRPQGQQPCARDQFKSSPEPFIKPCHGQGECSFPDPIRIPAGHWFMMGDNRGESDDSRFWGPVPESWIVGEAFATYWPPDRIGTL